MSEAFKPFRHCQNGWEDFAHRALKVTVFHFCPVDFSKTYIVKIKIKIVKKWCICSTSLLQKKNNLIALKMGRGLQYITMSVFDFSDPKNILEL